MVTAEELAALPWTRELVPDGDGWSASIVELRGCFAEGDSEEEALRNLKAVLLDWLTIALEHGDAIPEPRGLDRRFSGRFSVRVPK